LVSPIVEVPQSIILDSQARVFDYCHSSFSSAKSILWQDLVPQQKLATIADNDPPGIKLVSQQKIATITDDDPSGIDLAPQQEIVIMLTWIWSPLRHVL